MVAARTKGKLVIAATNLIIDHFSQSLSGSGLSRLWLVLARLCLLFTQVVAMATTFAPELRSAAPVLRHYPRSTTNKAG